jgi:hypothetical protein
VLLDACCRWQDRRRDASQQRHYKSDADASPVVRKPQQSITTANVPKLITTKENGKYNKEVRNFG